jgi:glycine betaine catabolism B
MRELPRPFGELPPWHDRTQKLEVVAVAREAPDVATFTFRAADGGWFRYLPGQFITLELPTPHGVLLRTYTLSSSPSRPLTVSVTVKAQTGSLGTRWMLDHLVPGTRLQAYGPAGVFSFHLHPADKYLFVSAGSGVTPMLSMARWAQDTGHHADINFVTCARQPRDLIARHELEAMAARSRHFGLSFVVEAPDPDAAWTGYRGRVSLPMLRLMAPDLREREVFCCGPAPFMAGVRAMLAEAGCDPSRYHEESFQPEADLPLPVMAPADAPLGRVRFTLSNVEVAAGDGETILVMARGAGLNIPSGCTMGLCGTCKVRCLSGETVMAHQGGIREDEVAEGLVLACCTRPIGRVEIEV